MKFVKSGEKKKLLRELEEQFGIKKLNYLLIETGKNKFRGFSGNMTREEIRELGEIANVEIVGLYLFRKEGQIRLSLDGSMILSEQIDKNVIEINDEQLGEWLLGKNLEIEKDSGIYVICTQKNHDFLGCGVSDGKKVINYVPKERRVRRS